MHIKEALGWVIMDLQWNNLNQIRIQSNDNPNERKKAKEVEDEELINLLKYMQSKKEDYKSNKKCLILKKSGNEWQQVAIENCK